MLNSGNVLQFAIENGDLQWIHPLKMVMFPYNVSLPDVKPFEDV